jgi:hypothetical protein
VKDRQMNPQIPVARLNRDTLDDVIGTYNNPPLLTPIFLNSVPKCGTHLIRNIFRMFVPVEQTWTKAFVQYANMYENLDAFSLQQPRLSWGHLIFGDDTAVITRLTRHILIVRDPYDWVLARARFMMSDQFENSLDVLKNGAASTGQLLNMMIFGVYNKVPSLAEMFKHNGVSWMGTEAKIIKLEDLTAALKALESDDAEAFFRDLFGFAGMTDLPSDWRERIQIGADPKQSGTAREKLSLKITIPDELPDVHKKLVDYAAPGLREILGYT